MAFFQQTAEFHWGFFLSLPNIINLFGISFLAKYIQLDSITFHAILMPLDP